MFCLRTIRIFLAKHSKTRVGLCAFSTERAGQFEFDSPLPELDFEYLCNHNNKLEIETNIKNRKGVGDIDRVHELHKQLKNLEGNFGNKNNSAFFDELRKDLRKEALKIPNKSHNLLNKYGEEACVVKTVGDKKTFMSGVKEFSDISKTLHLARTENIGNLCGHKSYYFMGELAEMEQAVVQFAVNILLDNNFQIISVPDILHSDIVESCGINTKGDRTQVYMLDPNHYGEGLCLSGTSEMAIAGFLMNRVFAPSELPTRLAAVSRCFRAETSSLAEERGIYRVHQFTKVEMFGVTDQDGSSTLLEEFCRIQEQSFESLGLHFKILDMPPKELGAPAYRKYDIEAWMPGRQLYGEISSCSSCTDYQARRLNIKYKAQNGRSLLHAHTINGTACAVPRLLIALLETHQQEDGTISIPAPLQKYMNGKTTIRKQCDIPEMKLLKNRQTDVKKP